MPPSIPCGPDALRACFGSVDIYVFDQLLRGRITPAMRVLDAGCGSGRNLRYLLACGGDAWGVDRDPAAVRAARAMAVEVGGPETAERFQVAEVADLPFPDGRFDAVLSSAVLHFAEDEEAFEATLAEMWRVLAPGGLLFARLASTIGVEGRVARVRGRRFALPDGPEWFLVDEAYLRGLADLLGATLLDPLKTTNVENRRAMTTWVLRKEGSGPASLEGAAALRTRALAPLLERLEPALYRAPDAGGGEAGWSAAEEAALEGAASGYGDDVRRRAAELADLLRELRTGGTPRAEAGSGPAGAAPGGGPAPSVHDRAKAALSGLKTLVLVEDALREDG